MCAPSQLLNRRITRHVRRLQHLHPSRTHAAMHVLRAPQRVSRVDDETFPRELVRRHAPLPVRIRPRPAREPPVLRPVEDILPISLRTKIRTVPLDLPFCVVNGDESPALIILARLVRREIDAHDCRDGCDAVCAHEETTDIHARRLLLRAVHRRHIKHLMIIDLQLDLGHIVGLRQYPNLLLITL